MQVCNYCGRVLKNHFDICPGCGSSDLKKLEKDGQLVIDIPPEGGYHIDMSFLEQQREKYGAMKIWGIAILSFFIVLSIVMISEDFVTDGFFEMLFVSFLFIMGPPILLGIVLIFVGSKKKKEYSNHMIALKKLTMSGVLIKNMKYELEDSGYVKHGKKGYRIKVLYEDEKGNTIPLLSDIKYLSSTDDLDQTADLLIDLNDYSNHYIAFEIY